MLWLWLGFFALVGLILLLQRKVSQPTFRSGFYWTAGWFVIGLSFVGLIYPMYEHAWLGAKLVEPSDKPGADASVMFLSAYLLEYALTFESVRGISLQCRLHHVPKRDEASVMYFGLVATIVVRVVVVTAVVCLARAFTWMFYVGGALIFWSGVVALKGDIDKDAKPSDSLSAIGQRKHMRVARFLWRHNRLTDRDVTGKFWLIQDGRRVFTMAAGCVLSIVLIDLVFALDSAFAAVSVSRTAFILVTSNILASITLRTWCLMLDTTKHPQVPRKAIAVLLGLIGVKLLVQNHVQVPHSVLLFAIAALIGSAVAESVLASRYGRVH